MSLKNLGELARIIKLVNATLSQGNDFGKALGSALKLTDTFKDMDASALAKMLNTFNLGSDTIRNTLTALGKETKDIDNAIAALASSGSKSMLHLEDVFTGLGATFKKWLGDLKDGAIQAGKSIATFITSPVGIATAGLIATIGVGLYEIKQEYDKSFDGISESLEQFREDTKKTEDEISDSQTKLAQNLERIAELKTQDATIDNTKEIASLERENALLAAQIAYRETLLRIQEETEAKAARNAYNVGYDSYVASEGEVKYDAVSGRVYSTEVIKERTIAESYQADIDLLEDLQHQYSETADASNALIRKRAILEGQGLTDSEEWKTLNSQIEGYANEMETLQGKILEVETSATEKKGVILDLYQSCFRLDGSIVDGYEDLVAAIENTFPEIGGVESVIDSAISSYREKFSTIGFNDNFIESNVAALENWFDSLPDEDRKLVYEIALNYDTAGWALSQWDAALQSSKGDSIEAVDEVQNKVEDFAADTAELIADINSVRDILSQQATGTSLSADAYGSEELKAYTSALEYNNGALQLNREKVNELIEAKAEEQIANIESEKALAQTTYLEKAKEIEKLRKKLKDKNFVEDETAESIQATIDSLLDENKTLKSQNIVLYRLYEISKAGQLLNYARHKVNLPPNKDYLFLNSPPALPDT